MNMNQMMQFLRQIPGKLSSNSYSSLANDKDPNNIAFIRQLQREMKKQDVLQIPFSKLNLVVFDLETTGFYPYKGDQILSIGAVKIEEGKLIEENPFYSLVYSSEGLSSEISALTGLVEDDLKEAPPIDKVLASFFQYVKSDPLVAHHASHERSFMQHVTWSVLKTRFEHRVIDTSFLLKVLQVNKNLVTLDDCCEHYGIEIGKRHHALEDALATAKLWLENVRLVQEQGFLHLKDVYSYLASQK